MNRRFVLALRLMGVAVGTALLIGACGSASPSTATPAATAPKPATTPGAGVTATAVPLASPTATATPKAQPKMGGTITLAYWAYQNIVDPSATQSAPNSGDYWGAISDRLLSYDWDNGKPIAGGLAESWEYKTPTELVIRLKKGIRFQTQSLAKGREMDSGDVVTTLNRLRRSDAPFAWGPTYRFVTGYEAVDKNTVKATFKNTDANYLYNIAGYGTDILPRELFDKYPDNASNPDVVYGTGPFVWDQAAYRADSSGAANRNPNYDLLPGKPYLDRLQWVGILDISARTAAIRTGQADVSTVPTIEADSFRKAGYSMGGADKMQAVSGFYFNVKKAPTSDWKFRKALMMAVDFDELLAVVGDGYGCVTVITGCWDAWYLSAKDFQGEPGFRDKKTDIAEAKKLLAEGGYDPTKMTLEIVSTQSQYKVYFEQSLTYKGQLEKAFGFKVNLTQNPAYSQKDGLVTTGKDISGTSRGGVGTLNLDTRIYLYYYTGGAANTGGWSDPKTDQLIDAQAAELDPGKRKALFGQLQRHLLSDGTYPLAPNVRNFDWFAAQPKVKDWKAPSYFTAHFTWQYAWIWLDK